MRHSDRRPWDSEGRASRRECTRCPARAAKLLSQAVLRPVIKQVALRWIVVSLVPQRNIVTQVSLRECVTQLPLRPWAIQVARRWMFVVLVPQQNIVTQVVLRELVTQFPLRTQVSLRELVTQLPLRPLVKQEALHCPWFHALRAQRCRRSIVVAVEPAVDLAVKKDSLEKGMAVVVGSKAPLDGRGDPPCHPTEGQRSYDPQGVTAHLAVHGQRRWRRYQRGSGAACEPLRDVPREL